MMEKVFTPLSGSQGLSIIELKNTIQQRDLYIWGAGLVGRGFKRVLERNGFTVKAFLDINPALTTIDSIAVLRPENLIQNVRKGSAFIICTVGSQSKSIEQQCLDAGLEKNKDFLSFLQVPRQQPVIEVGGVCNYFCSDCKEQKGKLENQHYMNAASYKNILDKLCAENPLLLNIDLSLWREPLCNPDIEEIIRFTNVRVLCKLISKLQNCAYLEDAVKANPLQIQIIAEGYENTYEQNQINGSAWKTFLANLYKLREYANKYKVDTEISMLYILYRNNNTIDLKKMKLLCNELGFKFITDTAYLTPYDNFLDVCEHRELSPQIQKFKELLTWNMEAVLKMCMENARRPCICQRIFPVINYDGAVSLCHLFCKPKVTANFLDVPYSKIVEERGKHKFCRQCQSYGLHRLDLEILKKYFPEKDMM
ncbi:MAG: hypothetical protein LBH18_07230 [Spirochaetaceae bacterium]|jgi:hypothetical protein|nr:hypothetical protein [Spirochaetaceae bacterium]